MYIGLHAKYPLFLSDFNITWNFLDRFFENYLNIKLHENPSSGSRGVQCGQTEMMKLLAMHVHYTIPHTGHALTYVLCTYF